MAYHDKPKRVGAATKVSIAVLAIFLLPISQIILLNWRAKNFCNAVQLREPIAGVIGRANQYSGAYALETSPNETLIIFRPPIPFPVSSSCRIQSENGIVVGKTYSRARD